MISLIAVFLSVAFLGQIFSVFTAIELRYKIRTDRIPSADTDRVSCSDDIEIVFIEIFSTEHEDVP